MLFHIEYTLQPSARNDAQSRFQETGGGPPEGATMVGRWHKAGGLGGFLLAESSDPVAIGKWMQQWTDLLEFEVTPVLNDEQVMEVLE